MALTEKDLIEEENLTLIMNCLWRINLYVVTTSMDNSNPLNIINFIILRVQFQNFSGGILQLIILIF